MLFADVARSTAIAEKLDPEDWALIMNGAFGFMNTAVSRYGGTVSRLMGRLERRLTIPGESGGGR